MLKDGLDEITQDLGLSFEEAQNTLHLKARLQLLSYMNDKNYLTKQLQARGKFKLSLLRIANEELKQINAKYDKAFEKASKQVNLKHKEQALKRLQAIKQQNQTMMLQLTEKVYQAHGTWLTQVSDRSRRATTEIGELKKSNKVYDSICDVLNTKEAQQEVGVVYSNGRVVPFKSYMEMNARTTLNQEISQQQMENAPSVGVVFWLCNSFDNCRPDHLDFQGKTYYDERYISYGLDEKTLKAVEEAIDSRNMLARQEVENNDPYLGNCPNCRHEFIAVPIEDVISMSDKELLKDNNLNVDRATEKKYATTQQQRLYERKIRDYKFKLEQAKLLKENNPTDVPNQQVERDIEHNKVMLDRYKGKIKELISNNDYLERDYARESVKILRDDLGYRANKSK